MEKWVSGASTALTDWAAITQLLLHVLIATLYTPLMSPISWQEGSDGPKYWKCFQTFLLTTSLWLNTHCGPDTYKQFLLPSGVSGTQEAADDGSSNHPNSSNLIRDEACVRGGRIATKSIGRYSIQRPYRDSVKLTEKICLTLNNL